MSYFQTVILFFLLALVFGAIFDRFFTSKTTSGLNALYGGIGFGIVILIFWTLIQMLFQLPQLDSFVPISAILMGVIFAAGLKGAYVTLKQRSALKKRD